MKKYIETKQIEAEPMTLGDFVQETGRNPYGKDIENHKETCLLYTSPSPRD